MDEHNGLTTPVQLKKLTQKLLRLLEDGSCVGGDEEIAQLLHGLAHPCASGQRWVVSQRLLAIRQRLNSDAHLAAAILATHGTIRQPWLALMAARCKEAAQLSDPLQLVERINQLGSASDWVEAQMENASLSPTLYGDIERELLGMAVEQAACVPILVRVLQVASTLSQWQNQALPALQTISTLGDTPSQDWVPGRLLTEPCNSDESREFQYLLNGQLAQFNQSDFDQLDINEEKARMAQVMPWLEQTPWAYLLAAMVYEQDIWRKEGRWNLKLELGPGQNASNPTFIQVVVENHNGDEVLCGSLAEYVRRILDHLEMGLFPGRMSDNELNAALAPVIGALVRYQVWRYQDGESNEAGVYLIGEPFFAACYRKAGHWVFSIEGEAVRAAIRQQAVQWYRDSRQLHNDAEAQRSSLGVAL